MSFYVWNNKYMFSEVFDSLLKMGNIVFLLLESPKKTWLIVCLDIFLLKFQADIEEIYYLVLSHSL